MNVKPAFYEFLFKIQIDISLKVGNWEISEKINSASDFNENSFEKSIKSKYKLKTNE